MASVITAGGTDRVQNWMGTADMVDRGSAAFRYGGNAGQAWNIVASFAAPGASAAFSLMGAGAAAVDGDWTAAGMGRG